MISNLNNEEGSAIIVALIVLLAITMIGIVSTDDTVVELGIVRNEAIYRHNLYRAESAVIEAAQFMDDNNLSLTYSWIPNVGANFFETPNNWTAANSNLSNNMNNIADPNNNTRYAARLNKVVGSRKMTASTSLYAYSVYGFFDSTTGQGRSLVKMGYSKRY